jgi:hypothetical protein
MNKGMLKEAQDFVNYLRTVRPNRNWPTPIEYIGGGKNGKVYLTNSGKLMKIGLGSNPREFRPLHILRNTGFVPKFNQRNWAIIPVRTKGRTRNYVSSAKKLFGLQKILPFKHTIKKLKMKRRQFANLRRKPNKTNSNLKEMKNLKNFINQYNTNIKKATVFLMNKINGKNVMTLHTFLATYFPTEAKKNIIRKEIFEMIKAIKYKGISHGNLHGGNILVSISPTGVIKLWMIDFGRSRVIPIGMTERNLFSKMNVRRMFNSRGLLSRPYEKRQVPVINNSRANVHMSNIHYGMPFNRATEAHINISRMRRLH